MSMFSTYPPNPSPPDVNFPSSMIQVEPPTVAAVKVAVIFSSPYPTFVIVCPFVTNVAGFTPNKKAPVSTVASASSVKQAVLGV